jgi:hypothetical protein
MFCSTCAQNTKLKVGSILFTELGENEMKITTTLHSTLRRVMDVFDLSASDNLIAPSLPISLPVLSENENEAKSVYNKC